MLRPLEAPLSAPPPSQSSQTPPSASQEDVDARDPLGLFGRTVAGRFAAVQYLGCTSVAHIYRAVHTLMEQPCFLKITAAEAETKDGVPAALKREAQAAARCNHSAILRMYDAGRKGEYAYLAQEWSNGPNLRALMGQNPPVSVPDMLDLALQLLDVICALHRLGVVLRAFDPERILVPIVNGKTKLRLFDLAQIAYVGEKLKDDASQSRHPTGFKVRSTRYMAPEEIREEPVDPRADLYSYGVLLCEMITGEYPYAPRGSGPTAYVVSHLREEVRSIVFEGREGVPQDLPGIVRRLLAKDPGDRFETAEAARRALEDIIVPDLIRLNTASDRHVLEAWRKRVKLGLRATNRLSATRIPSGIIPPAEPH